MPKAEVIAATESREEKLARLNEAFEAASLEMEDLKKELADSYGNLRAEKQLEILDKLEQAEEEYRQAWLKYQKVLLTKSTG